MDDLTASALMEAGAQTQRRSFRRRLLRIFIAFSIIQAIVAALVMRRGKRALVEREQLRPDDYQWMSFPTVEVPESGESIQLYMHGTELLGDIVQAIDAARDRVYLETFIWVDDVVGRTLNDALERAVARGVAVYVMYDALLSSRGLDKGFFPDGCVLLPFRPMEPNLSALRPSNLLRDHRKVVVIDGTVGFIGGYNFGEEYISWRDTHIRITGETVIELENAFIDFWNQHRDLLAPRIPDSNIRSWDPGLLVHRNDPSLGIFPIRGMYMEAIDRAQRNVWITNAYFVPDRSFRESLNGAARRGVDVRVMLPARSNHVLADALAHGIFDDLLAAGVRIFLYRQFMVHAKTCTIDGMWSTIGTANLDRWSMMGNYEINAEIRSTGLAGQMEQMFELDLQNCIEVPLDAWRRRPVHMRLAEQTLRSLAPLM